MCGSAIGELWQGIANFVTIGGLIDDSTLANEAEDVGNDIGHVRTDKLLSKPKSPPPPPTLEQATAPAPQIGEGATKAALTQGSAKGLKRSQKSAARLGTSQFVIPPPQGINLPR